MHIPGILSVWNDRDDAIASLYERWYVSEHIPERLGVPGFVSARRYEAPGGGPRFLTYYDVLAPQVLTTPDYLAKLAAPSELTRQVMGSFRNMTRTVCQLAFRSPASAIGGSIVAAYIEQPDRIDFERLVKQAHGLASAENVLSVQVWRAEPDAAHAVTTEAKLRPGADARIEGALLAEVQRMEDSVPVQRQLEDALKRSIANDAARIRSNAYRLLGVWQAR